jgi:hypothetical protein
MSLESSDGLRKAFGKWRKRVSKGVFWEQLRFQELITDTIGLLRMAFSYREEHSLQLGLQASGKAERPSDPM